MNFLFLILKLSESRGKIEEFPDFTTNYTGDQDFDANEVTPASYNYAYITSITGDDDMEHEVLKAAMLAYSLWYLTPKIDRILLISMKFRMPDEHEQRLAKLYTSVYRSPFVDFKCPGKLFKSSDIHHWFKLNAWTITSYEKLLWISPNVFFTKDPSRLFEFPAPAAPPDYQLWSMSEFGPVHNLDVFLFKPSLDDFLKLKELACDWISNPENSEKRASVEGTPFLGAYDNGLLEEFYKYDITTMPKYTCYEIPGLKDGSYATSGDETDPRIISYRFSKDHMPWDSPNHIVSQAWSYLLKKMFDALEEEPILKETNIFPPSSNTSLDIISRRLPKVINFTSTEFLETFVEYSPIQFWRIVFNACLIAITIFVVIIYALNNPSQDFYANGGKYQRRKNE
ncbi:hypothetical protein TVAG_232810 [Trichomonas vaginalis G3]|uniref:Uncharacterized protein n=1 Tax=Trichomonas vaginalis (strain ATCC PRA-98 / G3) TaxID=412133 RepID=A2FVZ5_TRIV3|nr:glycogenin subfamily member family [Trichomonas vaginalis G3]EAX90924.1 hypothetical protein TVAG_232810 [Trichomonas vaginalis G3]KAI5516454.1 glycogenin subfamily member family [Trichomonas vaginalis G3]|eukprot:XP_001303854.1 hypothetical protein [Trichomonas vaginalis G3]